jgi:hypothetical protein
MFSLFIYMKTRILYQDHKSKECSLCDNILPLSSFNLSSSHKNKKADTCIGCMKQTRSLSHNLTLKERRAIVRSQIRQVRSHGHLEVMDCYEDCLV